MAQPIKKEAYYIPKEQTRVPKTGTGSGLQPQRIDLRPDFKQISAKGGKSTSPRKKRAVILNALKTSLTKPETKAKWLLHLCTDPLASSQHILQLLTTINPEQIDTHTKIKLAQALNNWHKITHGLKQHVEIQGSVQLNAPQWWIELCKLNSKITNRLHNSSPSTPALPSSDSSAQALALEKPRLE